ncbi:hypothetical protein OG824_32020 [Streptomyces prunicolor]|uniref:hypothetical protein n=1 Tax=Streptomyces prunicolor TaxID=67348 RepID=UPI002251B47D|nr:hypothetical protein [Streptomyces prunicolor]MCX5239839.1 hypothetical protein [Streptomyces prunicolor]
MPSPKLSNLGDFFGGTALNTTLWNASSGSPNVTLDTALDRVAVSCTTSYYALGSTTWDATSSNTASPNGVYARVVPAPLGNGGTETYFEVILNSTNKASLYLSGGVFRARVINAGVSTTTTIAANWAAYDAYSYAWWRITEVSGSFVFATSPDGYTWTARATIAYSWSATGVTFQFTSGYFGTEAASSAYIDHVNTLTSAYGQLNLNWPVVEDGWGAFWNANGGTQPSDRYVEVTDRTRGTMSVSRGRQYETDQVRTGEASLILDDTDSALDPTNAGGPWAGHIAPYQPYRRRAQWPPTRNVLDQVMATGGDLGGFSGTISSATSDIFSSTDSSGGSFVSSATAWQGATVMQFAVPSATVATTRICHTPRWSVIPGRTYTVQLRVRDVTAATSLSVYAFFGWYTAGGGAAPSSFNYGTSTALTGSTTAGWTLLTLTATAPANAAGMDVGAAVASTAAAACSVQVDAWQLEKGSTATTWQAPGVWYPVYAGWTERWPSQWDDSGTYATVQPTAVDTFSLLSQQQLQDSLTQEINSLTPRFVYRLDDPAGSTTVTDWTGTNPPAQLGISKYGAGSLTFGNAITATDATGVYTGSSGTVATINNSNPGTNLITGGATFIRLSTAGIVGPADPTSWSRVIAFRYTGPMPTAFAFLWSCTDRQRSGGGPSGSHIYVYLDTAGKPNFWIQGPTGAFTATLFGGATNCVDGDWHLLWFGYNQATGQVFVSQDGATAAYIGSVPSTNTPTGLISDNVGGFVDATVGNGTTYNFKGDISFVAEFANIAAGSSQIANLYAAWKSACAGESSDARYARILRYAGYSGAYGIQTGLTTNMGPAAIDGQDAMTALQGVVDTENGAHYVDRSGALQFKARSARYNATTPVYVFGENAGEWPYETCELDYDSTHLSNQVTVTQEGTSQNFYATDDTSLASYFARTMARTINSGDANECQDAAGYLISRYKQPAQRVTSVKLHPSAIPALWPVCLSLELGTRVRLMRRTPGGAVTQVDCFVENIQGDWGDDNEVWYTLQCSPADLTPYGIFGAWHTTLATSPSSGVTTITVNASHDNTNPLAAQLAVGQQLVLGQNTANQETVTVQSVAATSAGWTTAVITLTAATTKSHTTGDTVCEPLPVGTTDPTTWDSVCQFDNIAFAY